MLVFEGDGFVIFFNVDKFDIIFEEEDVFIFMMFVLLCLVVFFFELVLFFCLL